MVPDLIFAPDYFSYSHYITYTANFYRFFDTNPSRPPNKISTSFMSNLTLEFTLNRPKFRTQVLLTQQKFWVPVDDGGTFTEPVLSSKLVMHWLCTVGV